MKKIKSLFLNYLYLDLRSLALLRISIGSILLADIIDRSKDLTALYTKSGALPLRALPDYLNVWWLPIHHISDQFEYQAVLFIIQAIVALMLIIGYKTIFATILSWILLNSLQNRNPHLFYGADMTLRLVLFWGMFLPWQAKFSVDSLNTNFSKIPQRFISVASAAFIIQLICIYFFAALLKSDPVWRKEGTALYYALSLDVFRSHLGDFLYHLPTVHKPLTFLVLIQEAFVPFLLFLPFKRDFMRCIVIILFIGLHIGFMINMNLGIFPWVSSAMWLALIPTTFWKEVVNRAYATSTSILKMKISKKKPTNPSNLTYNHLLINSITFFFLISILLFNIYSLPEVKDKIPESIKMIGLKLGIQQKWAIFAPYPSLINGWFVVVGTKYDNSTYDIYNNKAKITFEKPVSIPQTYESLRWLMYLRNISGSKMRRYVPYFSTYLCNSWNKVHRDEKIKHIQVWFIAKYTKPEYKYETNRILLDERLCPNE